MADILIVLDQPDVLLLLRQELRCRGHRVTLAADAERAFECLGDTRFDLVVVDVAMAVGDGREIVEELERGGEIPLRVTLGSGSGSSPGTVVELADAVLLALGGHTEG